MQRAHADMCASATLACPESLAGESVSNKKSWVTPVTRLLVTGWDPDEVHHVT